MATKKYGNVYKRGDSPFLWIWYKDANGERQHESTQTHDKKLAEQILDSRIREFVGLRKGVKAVSDMPYKDFANAFMRHYRARNPYETVKSHQSVVNEVQKFMSLIGVTRFSGLTTLVINKYITYKREVKKNRANTCKNHLKNLQTQFSWAQKNGLAPKDYNPAKEADKVEVTDAKEKGALSVKEYQQLMKVIKREYPYYYPIYYTFVHTGIRFSELIKLKWDDIKFPHKVLWIMKPKNKKKPDYVSMHDGLIKIINSVPKNSEYVFTDENGSPFGYRTRKIIRRLKSALRNANIKSINTLHELRHTHCSHLFDKGLTPIEVQSQMRHTELRTTQIYAHLFRPEYNKKISRLQQLDR